MSKQGSIHADRLIGKAAELRADLGKDVHAAAATALYERAGELTRACVQRTGRPPIAWDRRLDRILTSRGLGIPIMLVGLAVVLWLTIAGANYPSRILATALFWLHDQLAAWMTAIGSPAWLTGLLVHGVYRGLAWVVSVMLPPMAIFFPLFTLLEDAGYLPRVAFNLDRVFRWCGTQGKQSLTMGMGLGCNAAGVMSCRIIDSPRERLIAILTNNFVLCNGRWPTVIMLATVFLAATAPPAWAGIVATGAVAAVTLIGFCVALLVSRVLSRTALKGAPSQFCLELPPYRMPNVWRVIHRSIVDRTVFVLGRACVCAAPAGGLIWLLANVDVAGQSLMAHASGLLDPVAAVIGLDGVILLAYVIALPANEIVVPTIIMAYMATSRMTDLGDLSQLGELFRAHGWTVGTAVCMMLFCLLHYPCATTTWTIYRETGSRRWTLWANLMPLAIAVAVCAAVHAVWKLAVPGA